MFGLAVRLRDSALSKRYRKMIAGWPSYQEIPTGQLSFRIKLWLRVISSLFSAIFRMSEDEFVKLHMSRKHSDTPKGDVLVMANGPSASQLTREQLKNFVQGGGTLFAMNGYLFSELADEFSPDLYFLTDPDVWLKPRPNDHKFQEKLEIYMTSGWNSTTIVQPVHQEIIVKNHSKYIFLTHLTTSGFLPFRNPFFLWGLAPSTALLALAVASRMGFERIFFAGLDGDSYRHFYTDNKGLLKWQHLEHHFYHEVTSIPSDISESSFEGILVNPKIIPTIGDALYAEAVLRRDFKRLSRNEFINATPSRYFDLGKRGGFGYE